MICTADTPIIFFIFFFYTKSRKKIQEKAIQGHVLWLNLKYNFKIFFFKICRQTLELLCSDPWARLKTQIPMHSINWGCPKIVFHSDPVSLLISTFCFHLEPGCKSHDQIIHYRTAKDVQEQATVFLHFETNSYNLTRKVFLIFWPVNTHTNFFFPSRQHAVF